MENLFKDILPGGIALGLFLFYILVKDFLPLFMRKKHNEGEYDVFSIIRNNEELLKKIEPLVEEMCDDVSDLKEWHNTKDTNGVFRWIVKDSLEKAISDLIGINTRLLRILEKIEGKL